jgi:hypothetical protein
VSRGKRRRGADEDARKRIARNILSYTMPNGKPLRDCTFAECTEFGGRRYTKLGGMGRPDAHRGNTTTMIARSALGFALHGRCRNMCP